MSLWSELARVLPPSGDEILLRQRGTIYEIRYNGIELMSNLNHHSEDELAARSLRRAKDANPKVLIGGLGLGFTLRAVLNYLGPKAEVTVCELIPEIVEWNRGPLAHLADAPLEDPRVRVIVGDVQDHLAVSPGAYDAILLDTDNGPDHTVRPQNAPLYARDGIDMVGAALRPGGLAAFWSATISPPFEAAMSRKDWYWTREDVALVVGRADALHHIYFAAFTAERLGLRMAS